MNLNLMKKLKVIAAGLLISQLLFSQTDSLRNVIFLIGDGMGINQIYAASLANNKHLYIEDFPNIGFSKTYSYDHAITDSGAGGTAIACGVKTRNGMIGMTPDSISTPSIMEILKGKGVATGLVVSCNVTHATPASFVAHQVNRYMTNEIAADYLNSNIDFFAGGGKDDFEKRKDKRNLSNELREKGYDIVYSISDLENNKSPKIGALLADNHLPDQEKRGDQLYQCSKAAINSLNKNKKGFFLMIEGSQIDWEGHNNNGEGVINEVLDFDKVVKLCLDFAKEDKHTLVIITADHETGGLSLITDKTNKKETIINFSTKKHSASPVPVFSYGPNAKLFTGFQENTSFFGKIEALYKIK